MEIRLYKTLRLYSVSLPLLLTILPHIHTDVVNRGEVGDGRLHGSACGPHVVEEEDWHSGKTENAQPSQAQDVGQEHKLWGNVLI